MPFDPREALDDLNNRKQLVRTGETETGGFDPQSALDQLETGEADEMAANEPLTDVEKFAGERVGTNSLDLFTRLRLAGADNDDERRLEFKRRFPDGEIVFVHPVMTGDGEGAVTLFREKKSDPLSRVDKPDLDGLFDQGFAEFLGDAIDFLGDDVGTMAAAILSARRGGGKISFKDFPRIASFEAAGELLQEGETALRGTQTESLETVSKRAAVKGSAAFGGARIIEPVFRRVANIFSGKGLLKISNRAAEANTAAKELLDQSLPIDVLSANPIVQQLGRQSRALAPGAAENLPKLQSAVAAAIKKSAAGEDVAALPKILLEETSRASREFLRAQGKIANTSPAAAGTALRQGREQFLRESQARVSLAFDYLRSLGRVEHNPVLFEEAQAVAREISFGVRGQFKGATKPSSILNVEGKPARAVPIEGKTVRLDISEESKLLKIVDDIQRLDPALPTQVTPGGVAQTNMDQIRALMSSLFEFTQPRAGEAFVTRAEQAAARRLRSKLGDIISRPTTNNGRMISAHKKAMSLARSRFADAERSILIEVAKTDTPSTIAKRIIGGGEPIENLTFLRRIMPVRKFKQVQNFAITELRRDPFTITDALASIPPEVRAALFNPKQLAHVRKLGLDFDKMTRIGLQDTLQNQSRASGLVNDLVNRSDTANIDLLGQFVKQTGGAEAPLGVSLRAGIIDSIYRKSTSMTKQGVEISKSALENELGRLRATGGIDLLTKSDIRMLENAELVSTFLTSVADAGTSLQRASAVASLRDFALEGVVTVLQTVGIGKLITSKAGEALIRGSGARQISTNVVLGAISQVTGALAVTPEVAEDASNNLEDFIRGIIGLEEQTSDDLGR